MRKTVLASSLIAGLIFSGSVGVAAADSVDTLASSAAAADAPRPPKGNETAVPPGSPGDEDGDGILDTTVQPDNPDTLSAADAPRPPKGNETAVPPGSPGDEDGDGILDTTVQPDNIDG